MGVRNIDIDLYNNVARILQIEERTIILCISCALGIKEYSNPSIFKGPNSTLVQVFLCLIFLEKLRTSCPENKNLHNSTEKNKENMKGWDYSQPTNGDYHLREST